LHIRMFRLHFSAIGVLPYCWHCPEFRLYLQVHTSSYSLDTCQYNTWSSRGRSIKSRGNRGLQFVLGYGLQPWMFKATILKSGSPPGKRGGKFGSCPTGDRLIYVVFALVTFIPWALRFRQERAELIDWVTKNKARPRR
jgi:hypothetical protein